MRVLHQLCILSLVSCLHQTVSVCPTGQVCLQMEDCPGWMSLRTLQQSLPIETPGYLELVQTLLGRVCKEQEHSVCCDPPAGNDSSSDVSSMNESSKTECEDHTECSSEQSCNRNGRCESPCPGPCGPNTECEVRNHFPVCSCLEGTSGDPYTGCTDSTSSVTVSEPTNVTEPETEPESLQFSGEVGDTIGDFLGVYMEQPGWRYGGRPRYRQRNTVDDTDRYLHWNQRRNRWQVSHTLDAEEPLLHCPSNTVSPPVSGWQHSNLPLPGLSLTPGTITPCTDVRMQLLGQTKQTVLSLWGKRASGVYRYQGDWVSGRPVYHKQTDYPFYLGILPCQGCTWNSWGLSDSPAAKYAYIRSKYRGGTVTHSPGDLNTWYYYVGHEESRFTGRPWREGQITVYCTTDGNTENTGDSNEETEDIDDIEDTEDDDNVEDEDNTIDTGDNEDDNNNGRSEDTDTMYDTDDTTIDPIDSIFTDTNYDTSDTDTVDSDPTENNGENMSTDDTENTDTTDNTEDTDTPNDKETTTSSPIRPPTLPPIAALFPPSEER